MRGRSRLNARCRRGVLAAAITFALLVYWFAFANRYAIFLYGHVDHPGDPPARAFDALTRTRYVMAGFAAAGYGAAAELALAIGARSGAARSRRTGTGPRHEWVSDGRAWRRYAPTALCLAAAATVLVSRVNFPTLPMPFAVAVGATAAAGFGLAMMAREAADGGLNDMLWLAADGAGPAMVVLGWRVIELPERGQAAPMTARLAAAGVVIGALAWSAGVSRLRARRAEWGVGAPPRSVRRALAAGSCLTLLAFPVLHHLHTLGAYPYITAAQNVGGYHVGTWAQAVVIAVGVAVVAVRSDRGEVGSKVRGRRTL